MNVRSAQPQFETHPYPHRNPGSGVLAIQSPSGQPARGVGSERPCCCPVRVESGPRVNPHLTFKKPHWPAGLQGSSHSACMHACMLAHRVEPLQHACMHARFTMIKQAVCTLKWLCTDQPQIPPKHMQASRKILLANQNTSKAIAFRHGLQNTNEAQSLSSQIHHYITEFKLSTQHILFQ